MQVHAHQLHNNNCWGINYCVIMPAPVVISEIFWFWLYVRDPKLVRIKIPTNPEGQRQTN